MEREIQKWLNEGKQSEITSLIKNISNKFEGDEFDKIDKILRWIEKNIPAQKEYGKIIKIFSKRKADKIIKDKFNTGCHDTAVLTATFLRAVGIPAKFVEGIDKLNPKNRGHCVVEAYVKGDWILIDPESFTISLKPNRNLFYKTNYVIGKGLDAWDLGIKSFDDWKNKSNDVIKQVKKIK